MSSQAREAAPLAAAPSLLTRSRAGSHPRCACRSRPCQIPPARAASRAGSGAGIRVRSARARGSRTRETDGEHRATSPRHGREGRERSRGRGRTGRCICCLHLVNEGARLVEQHCCIAHAPAAPCTPSARLCALSCMRVLASLSNQPTRRISLRVAHESSVKKRRRGLRCSREYSTVRHRRRRRRRLGRRPPDLATVGPFAAHCAARPSRQKTAAWCLRAVSQMAATQ